MTVGSCETNEAYRQTMHQFGNVASDFYKKALGLDAKVRRWQNTPAEALAITSRHRDIASALQAASQGFQLSAKKPPQRGQDAASLGRFAASRPGGSIHANVAMGLSSGCVASC